MVKIYKLLDKTCRKSVIFYEYHNIPLQTREY
nr:MAG TPA: hypothetical protein [Caudoviricetes sp.]